MRLTIACPQAHTADANQLAMVLGLSEADGLTFAEPQWQDADGNLYSAASFDASEQWIVFAQAPLTRPAWDTGNIIDMDAAERAQAGLVFSTEAVPASHVALTAIGGPDGPDAMAAMGLTPVEEGE